MFIIGRKPEGYIDEDIERQFEEPNPEKQAKRSAFEIDKGRIIHSSAFRRLQGKTQVLGAGRRDFYRTRLTHSLEVAQIGRGICNEIPQIPDFNVDTDLVEAICLAHDIGHPPFGHSGEGFLNKSMYNDGGFGANAQNLRVVTFVETKRQEGGLNLSRAVLDGLTKYPTLFRKKDFKGRKPEFVYKDHAALLKWIKNGVRSPIQRPIECEIAEWADTSVYSVNDIEDNFRAGLLDFQEMEKRADEIEAVCQGYKITAAEIKALARDLHEKLVIKPTTLRQRKAALKAWTSSTIFSLFDGCKFYVRDADEKSNRYKYGLRVPDVNKRKSKLLKAAAQVLAFKDPRVVTLEHKGRLVLETLYKTFCDETNLLPRDFQEMIASDKKNTKRIVADFVSGMTDTYAGEYYLRLFQPGEGSFYEDV
jgi:dGTPase